MSEELNSIAERFELLASSKEICDAEDKLKALEEAAERVGKSFSGSWLGYHANIYYKGLNIPPPGVRFSQEWGLMETFGGFGSRGDWVECDPDDVSAAIRNIAGDPDISEVLQITDKLRREFISLCGELQSILRTELSSEADTFLERLLDEAENLKPLNERDVAQFLCPSGQIMTRDTTALGQGNRLPPHCQVLSQVGAVRGVTHAFDEGARISRQASSHLARKSRTARREARVGTNVFIGHGRSPMWRELKDFVKDRLKLPWDEFNRVPVAGVTNQARLSEMLDASALALIIMTAEDETAEGKVQARMNVIHEVGLFQGRLGFTRAIVLLENGCEEFSNIAGIGQIRFPIGNIGACFEEVRRVAEREGLVPEEG